MGDDSDKKYKPGRRVPGVTSYSQEVFVVGRLSNIRVAAGGTDYHRVFVPYSKPEKVTISTSVKKVWAMAPKPKAPFDEIVSDGTTTTRLSELWVVPEQLVLFPEQLDLFRPTPPSAAPPKGPVVAPTCREQLDFFRPFRLASRALDLLHRGACHEPEGTSERHVEDDIPVTGDGHRDPFSLS